MVLSLLGMLVYIWIRFELRFGVGAVMACIHDVLVTLGLFALLGFEFNLTTVAAFLTLIGYSVNDTVVIFDRIRENMRKTRGKPLIEIMNESINQTLSRTILTGGSTLLGRARAVPGRRRRDPRLRLRDVRRHHRRHLLVDLHREPVRAALGAVFGKAAKDGAKPAAPRPTASPRRAATRPRTAPPALIGLAGVLRDRPPS